MIAFSVLLALIFEWNNSGLTTGNLARLINYRLALVVSLGGMLVGFLAEGSKMSHSVLGGLVESQVFPVVVLGGIAASAIPFLALTITKIPVSLSNCLVGSFAGTALASGAVISEPFLVEILASWVLAPLLCAVVSIAVYKMVTRAEASLSLPTLSWTNRIILLVIVFYVSYALGANNVGLIFSFIRTSPTLHSVTDEGFVLMEIVVFLAVASGTILFGKSIAKVIGEKIIGLGQIKTLAAVLSTATVTWIFTQLSLPVSLTQVVIGGMLGAGVAHGPTVFNRREFSIMIRDWGLVTILCALIGFVVEYYLVRAGI